MRSVKCPTGRSVRSGWNQVLALHMLALGVLMVGLAPSATAQGRGPGACEVGDEDCPEPRMERALQVALERHAEELGLTAADVARVRQHVEATRAAGEPLRDRMRSERRRLHELVTADEPSRADVLAQVDALGRAEIAWRRHQAEAMLDLQAMLTPEQRQRLRQFLRDHRPRHGGEGRGPRGRDQGQDAPPIGPRRGGPDWIGPPPGSEDARPGERRERRERRQERRTP